MPSDLFPSHDITSGFPVAGSVGTGVVGACGVCGTEITSTPTRVVVEVISVVGVGVSVISSVGLGVGVSVISSVGVGVGDSVGVGVTVGVGHLDVVESGLDEPQRFVDVTSHLYVSPGIDGNSMLMCGT